MTIADLLKIEIEKTEKELNRLKLLLPDVVVSFYCNDNDGEYHNNPCAEQCNFCKEVEKTLQ